MQSDSLVFSQALTQYLSTLNLSSAPDALNELTKFVWWCGRDRNVVNLTPQEAASYGELMSASSGLQDATVRAKAVKDFLTYCYKSNFTHISLAKHVRVKRTGRKVTPMEAARVAMDITPEGYQNLVDELESLRNERVNVAQEINLAAADKDFRENAPLDAAREHQGHMESRIRELEEWLQRARLVYTEKDRPGGKFDRDVRLGSKVKLMECVSKEKMTYTLVNASEASPMDLKMSVVSPVGKALMGHTIGEELEVNTPRGRLRYRIEEVD